MAVMARYNAAGLSDPGLKRQNNEDRFHADPERGIFFVIDGVGGHNAGEKAAGAAYDMLRARLERTTGSPADRIREAIALANNEIFRLASENDDWHGMACVLTIAVIEGSEITIGHVGDSRLYIVQPGLIRKATPDHSPVGEREDRGEIDELTAMQHPRRNEVYRDVGSEQHDPHDEGFIDVLTQPWSPESALLLCSDGLSDLVTSKQILAILERHAGDPQRAAQALVDAANDAGGKDNITVVIVEGPRFAPGVRRRSSSPRTALPLEAPRSPWYASPAAFLLYGVVAAAAAVLFFKPHWIDRGDGAVPGLGVVRPPRTFRVSSDIGNAIARAQPGDTVLVAPGAYNEQVRLRDGIVLISERPREAVLRASGVVVTGEDLRSGRIQGFRIEPDDNVFLESGIQLANSSVEIVDNAIRGTITAGIELQRCPGAVLQGNDIYAHARVALAILGDGNGPRVAHNTLTAEDGSHAVAIIGDARPVLTGNVIHSRDPVFAPPSLNVAELLRGNIVAPLEKAPPPQRRSATPQNAPSRIR